MAGVALQQPVDFSLLAAGFFAYYPSVFAYDAEGQLYQVLSEDYSTHHPLVHTLFLGAFFRLGIAAGSISTGMAVHSAVQMALMAGAFGRALSFLHRRRGSGRARAVLFLFFALFPANSVLAVSTTRMCCFRLLCCSIHCAFTAQCAAGAWE